MTSTRSRNMLGDYKLEQNRNRQANLHILDKQSVEIKDTMVPEFGINYGRVSNNVLSHNACDIESALFGINSSNLENPQPSVTTENKTLKSVSFFNKNNVVMPYDFKNVLNDRPMFLN